MRCSAPDTYVHAMCIDLCQEQTFSLQTENVGGYRKLGRVGHCKRVKNLAQVQQQETASEKSR